MSVCILWDDSADKAALYCTTTDWAFGPVFQGPEAQEQAQAFLDWLNVDPRQLEDSVLERLYNNWHREVRPDEH